MTGDQVELRLSGRTRAVHAESQAAGGGGTESERGVQTTLRGRATWDRAAGRFVRFELVAIGARWGATRFNERSDDLAPSPIGFTSGWLSSLRAIGSVASAGVEISKPSQPV